MNQFNDRTFSPYWTASPDKDYQGKEEMSFECEVDYQRDLILEDLESGDNSLAVKALVNLLNECIAGENMDMHHTIELVIKSKWFDKFENRHVPINRFITTAINKAAEKAAKEAFK